MSTEEKGYNGWSNFETWVMALWIDNDQGSYRYSRQLAEMAVEDVARGDDDYAGRTAQGLLADTLRFWIEPNYYDAIEATPGMFADLLGSSWERIDWYEIAENYLHELAEVWISTIAHRRRASSPLRRASGWRPICANLGYGWHLPTDTG